MSAIDSNCTSAETPSWRSAKSDARFFSKLNKCGGVPLHAPHLGECWLWTGAAGGNGYGQFWILRKIIPAHLYLVGYAPSGLEADHLCRVPLCANPSHIEFVTHLENVIRSTSPVGLHAVATHCPHGHPYDETNTFLTKEGFRKCRTCKRRHDKTYRERKGAA